jgi:hypothetical protein
MHLKLTEEQRQTLTSLEDPPRLLDEQTNTTYVLVRADLYEKMRAVLDQNGPNPVDNGTRPKVSHRSAEIPPFYDDDTIAHKQELTTFLRELPRLLAEGQEGRHVLIQGDAAISVWDTFEDGYQAALERFGLGVPFLVQPIEARYLDYPWPEELTPSKAP